MITKPIKKAVIIVLCFAPNGLLCYWLGLQLSAIDASAFTLAVTVTICGMGLGEIWGRTIGNSCDRILEKINQSG